MRADGTSAVNAGVRFALQTLKAQRVVRFKSNRGSHPHRSKMQPMQKSLVLQGFFGFLGLFFGLLFFATFSVPSGLEPATFFVRNIKLIVYKNNRN